MQIKSRELFLQVQKDLSILPNQVIHALTCDSNDLADPETTEQIKSFFKRRLPEAQSDVVEDYLLQNTKRRPIVEVYGRIESFDIIPDEEFHAIFSDSENGWNTFRQLFPLSFGILQISAAGFSSDGSQGLICIGQQVDWLAGAGFYHLYAKTKSGWKKESETTAWVS